ncbi:GtrA family protein [Opitutus terrae]|uniref:GtrA family protein n=1 Tax=Opitutus terrae (strain DSM 11246 / JCM 15787 / PB90-1) TaxID=452637 RepID=B1ZVR9_OPITP|nr:GtrA family protein [Opitutus terrae]ACB75005.1 GtrA family protein [Opitutus terrae PB90-1]
MRRIAQRVGRDRRARWFIVATVFTVFGLGLLKLLVGVLHWPYAVSTFVQSETCNLLRFFVNDRWVFGRRRPTWRRLVQYHVANALGFAVWWAGANALKAIGVHYLLASVLAMAGSFGVSWMTNFYWIWRKHHHSEDKPDPTPAPRTM